MFFPIHIKYKFYYFVTEASHGKHDNSNVDPQIDSPLSTNAEDSDDDVQICKFLFVPDKLF